MEKTCANPNRDVIRGVTSDERHFALAVAAVLDVLPDDRVHAAADREVRETELAGGFHEDCLVFARGIWFLVLGGHSVTRHVT